MKNFTREIYGIFISIDLHSKREKHLLTLNRISLVFLAQNKEFDGLHSIGNAYFAEHADD